MLFKTALVTTFLSVVFVYTKAENTTIFLSNESIANFTRSFLDNTTSIQSTTPKPYNLKANRTAFNSNTTYVKNIIIRSKNITRPRSIPTAVPRKSSSKTVILPSPTSINVNNLKKNITRPVPTSTPRTSRLKKTAFRSRTTLNPSREFPTTPVPDLKDSNQLYGCKKESSCACVTEDGRRLDLTPLAFVNGTARYLDVWDAKRKYKYSWNPCGSFQETDQCQNVAVCQIEPSSGLSYSAGTQDTVDFEVSSVRGLMIKYTSNPSAQQPGYDVYRTSYIQLRCDPNVEGKFSVEGEPVPLAGTYYMTLTSRYACLSNPVTVPTPPTPGSVTVTSGPPPSPIYNLKTIVDILLILAVVGAIGVVVLLMILVAVVTKQTSSTAGSTETEKQKLASKLSSFA